MPIGIFYRFSRLYVKDSGMIRVELSSLRSQLE
jgi:hypothetical protein